MKKILSVIIPMLLILSMSVFSFGCGGSDDSKGSNSTSAAGEAVEETAANADVPEAKDGDEFHVGDTFVADDLKIVYAASGEYYCDNEFMQPGEGNKYIFLKLCCENVGDSDENISYYDFNCYADGYEQGAFYGGDNELSATMSAGRTTEGCIYFEIPQSATQVEVEYSINLFSDEKIKLIYEGDVDSGYVAENTASVSENAVSVGETVQGSGIAITYVSCYQFDSDNQFAQPADGYRYLTFEFEVENTSDSDQAISSFSFNCFADGASCESCYLRDDELSADLSSGRKAAGTVTFEVPLGASVIEVEYEDNVWTDEKIVFLYSE